MLAISYHFKSFHIHFIYISNHLNLQPQYATILFFWSSSFVSNPPIRVIVHREFISIQIRLVNPNSEIKNPKSGCFAAKQKEDLGSIGSQEWILGDEADVEDEEDDDHNHDHDHDHNQNHKQNHHHHHQQQQQQQQRYKTYRTLTQIHR